MRPIVDRFHTSESGSDVAVVFVHGFTGDVRKTWNTIPDFLHAESKLAGWDLFGFGYRSTGWLDILNVWSADANLEIIAKELIAAADTELRGYKRLALVAHSMGGLVVQRALVQSQDLRDRVSHLVLFGTPSAGLVKASLISWWKQQTNNMSASGDFIRDLRKEWTRLDLTARLPFFLAVAGENDQFVPPASSLGPFPEKHQRVVPGNHVSMLQSASADAAAVKILLRALMQNAAPAGPRASARVAVERGEFQRVIDTLGAHPEQLDDGGAVSLALALDAVGRRQEAIQMLEAHPGTGTDARGVLAGRYKRQWLVERRRALAVRAIELYTRGYEAARSKHPVDHEQASYHGINLAFMELAYGTDYHEARARALQVLEHCGGWQSPKDRFWCTAAHADALLILGRTEEGIAKHRETAAFPLKPWQALSIQEQALRTADLCGCTPEEIRTIASIYEGGASK